MEFVRRPHRAPQAVGLPLLLLLVAPAREAAAQFPSCTDTLNGGWKECLVDGSRDFDVCGGNAGADGVDVVDVDRDGDLDVVTGWEESGKVFVYFNPHINPPPATTLDSRCYRRWPSVDITNRFPSVSIEDAAFADLDGNGAIDSVISSNELDLRRVGVHTIRQGMDIRTSDGWVGNDLPGESQFFMQAKSGRLRPRYNDNTVKTCNDIVVGAKGSERELPGGVLSTCDLPENDACYEGGIWWWECPKNSDGGPFGTEMPGNLDLSKWTKRKIHDVFWTMSLELVDMDGDGDLDVLFSDRRKVGWFENRTAQGNLDGWGNPILIEHMDAIRSVNRDGNTQLPWPSGGPYRFITRADVDGDGLEDVIATVNFSADVNALWVGRWYRRLDRGGRRWTPYFIAPTAPEFESPTNPLGYGLPYTGDHEGNTISKAVAAGDIDGDGKLDLVFSVRGTGTGIFVLTQRGRPVDGLWTIQRVAQGRSNYKFDNVKLADLDRDGDLDILSTDENVGPNSNGLGTLYYENPLSRPNLPPVAICHDAEVPTDGACSPVPASIDFGSYDPEDGPITVVQSPQGPYLFGQTPVSIAVTDLAAQRTTCVANVNVVDRFFPTIDAPGVTAECTSPLGTPVTLPPVTAQDACDGPLLPVGSPPALFSAGIPTLIQWQAADSSGNLATALQSVIVTDSTAPSVQAPPAGTFECTSAAGVLSAVIGTATAGDACDASVAIASDAPSVIPIGTRTVQWTASDDSGNASSATQLVAVRDTVAPSIQAPPPGSFECTTAAGLPSEVIGRATAADTCDVSVAITSNAPSALPIGSTTVTWTARDDSANATSAEQLVTVLDTVAPTLVAPPAVVVECTSPGGVPQAILGTASATDTCDASVAITSTAPSVVPIGSTTVIWTARDGSANATSAEQLVTVRDTVAPTLVAPPAVVIECTSPTGVPRAMLGTVSATDTCDASVAITSDAPSVVPFGSTTVTWTARDAFTNTTSAQQLVTVRDTVAPVIQSIVASPNTLWSLDRSMVAVTFAATSADACDVAPVCQITGISSDQGSAADWAITGPLTATLRAAREGSRDDRHYYVTLTCNDAVGNQSAGTTTVVVPHDQGPRN